MTKTLIGWRNRMGTGATLSGGSWVSNLPLANLLTTERAEVARSTNDATASTKFTVDFGQARTIRALALLNHNLSLTGSWRVLLGTTSGAGDIYTSAWQAAWFIPFGTGADEWESNAWWGAQNDEYTGHPYIAPLLLAQNYSTRWLTIEIDDTANPDGYVQIGRVFAGEAFDPEFGPAYGLKQGWKDASKVETNDSGAPFFDQQRSLRTVAFDLPYVGLDDSAILYEFQRRSGTTREVMYIPDRHDYQECQRYGFVGRLSELQPQSYNFYRAKALSISLEEWL